MRYLLIPSALNTAAGWVSGESLIPACPLTVKDHLVVADPESDVYVSGKPVL
jgi:hypothetical protein